MIPDLEISSWQQRRSTTGESKARFDPASCIGWIPGLKIEINFLYGRFFLLKKLEMIPLIKLVLGISKFWSNSLEIWFWKFRSDFEIAWVAAVCVGDLFSKSRNVYIFLRWSFWYAKSGVLIWFYINPRNFNPRNFQFQVGFLFRTFFGSHWHL